MALPNESTRLTALPDAVHLRSSGNKIPCHKSYRSDREEEGEEVITNARKIEVLSDPMWWLIAMIRKEI